MVGSLVGSVGTATPLALGTEGGLLLIDAVVSRFEASHDAARVRLIDLGFLRDADMGVPRYRVS